jgi:hypothetical protein
MRARRGATDDAVAPVERFDHPAVAGIEANVPRPPENVAGAHLVEPHLRELGRDRVCRSRQAYAGSAPRLLYEARAVKAGWARAAPAVPLADLRPGEIEDRSGLAGDGAARGPAFERGLALGLEGRPALRCRAACAEGAEPRKSQRPRGPRGPR